MTISWVGGDDWFSSEQPVLFPVFGQEIQIMAYTAAQPGVVTPAHVAALEGMLALPPERRAEWSAAVFAARCGSTTCSRIRRRSSWGLKPCACSDR